MREESRNAQYRDTPTFMFYDDNIYLLVHSILVLPERRHHTVSSIDAVPSAIQRSCSKWLFRRFARCCWCARWTVARISFMCTEAGVTIEYSETICAATGGDYKSFYSSVWRNVGCQSRATRRFWQRNSQMVTGMWVEYTYLSLTNCVWLVLGSNAMHMNRIGIYTVARTHEVNFKFY